MSTNEQYPVNDGGNSTSEQIPHSGVHGFEAPVTEFDNTSLQDAHDQGLLEVPENPSSLTKESKKGMSLKTKLALVLAGIGIAGTGGVVGKSMAGGETTPTSEGNPAASATPNPGSSETSTPEESTAPEQEPGTTTEFGFDTEAYVDNPEQLMTDFAAQYNTWQNSGFTEGVHDNDPRRFELGDDFAYAQEITAESNTAFATNVFIEEWGTNPNLYKFYEDSAYNHANTIEIALKTTTDVNQENEEHYKRFIDVTPGTVTAEATPEGNIVGTFEYTGRANTDKNNAEDVFGGGIDPNTEYGTYDVTFVNIDGELRLADIQVQSDNQ